MPYTAILYIAERCNQQCVFCLEEDGSWNEFVDPSTREVYTELERLYARGARHITFMGGETFFRKDLPRILSRAKSIGFSRIGVTTNGTVLSKKGFVVELVAAGLDLIEMSVHGHTEELANAISQSAITFKRQASALAEVNAIGSLFTIVNVVVCRENKDHLLDVARYVRETYPDIPLHFKFKFVSLQGSAAELAEVGARKPLRYEEVDLQSLGDYLTERGIPFWFYNVPLCRLGKYAGNSHELSTLSAGEKYFDLDHRGDGYYSSGYQLEGRVWPEATCTACTLRPVCPGLEETHRQLLGEEALATQTLDPVPFVEFALEARDGDPSQASARVQELAQDPRPSRFTRPRPEGALRFHHDDEPEPLDIVLEAHAEGRRAFYSTERFDLSYRPWAGIETYGRPRVKALLEAASKALDEADARGLSLDQARRAVLASAKAGWNVDRETDTTVRPKKRPMLPVFSPPGTRG